MKDYLFSPPNRCISLHLRFPMLYAGSSFFLESLLKLLEMETHFSSTLTCPLVLFPCTMKLRFAWLVFPSCRQNKIFMQPKSTFLKKVLFWNGKYDQWCFPPSWHPCIWFNIVIQDTLKEMDSIVVQHIYISSLFWTVVSKSMCIMPNMLYPDW